MATTVGGFSAIDDTEVDAESPITETLITRLRDNSYWIDAGTRRTGETSTTKVLTPNGSGGVAWVEVATIADPSIDGTKGSGVLGTSAGTTSQFAEQSGKVFQFTCRGPLGSDFAATIVLDQNDLSYSVMGVSDSNLVSSSGTATSSFVDILDGDLFLRVTGGNVEIYESSASAIRYIYLWL